MKEKKAKPTITDIAKATGMSIATVSRAMNHPELVNPRTAARIQEAMNQLEYAPKNNALPAVGETILINVDTSLNHFYSRVISGLRASARLHGFKTYIDQDPYDSEEQVEQLSRRIRLNNVRGIVFINSNSAEYFDRILEMVPLVQCMEVISEQHSYVAIDEQRAVFTVMDHIMNQGIRDIILLNGPLDSPRTGFSALRQQAFIDYMAQQGIPRSACRIINLPSHDYEMAFSSFSRLLNGSERPEAVFATSDLLAAAVVNAAYLNNISIPGQMLVAGFNNDAYSTVSIPKITTVSQPLFNMGYTAGEMIYDYINGRAPKLPRFIKMDTELIIRESTMRPAAD